MKFTNFIRYENYPAPAGGLWDGFDGVARVLSKASKKGAKATRGAAKSVKAKASGHLNGDRPSNDSPKVPEANNHTRIDAEEQRARPTGSKRKVQQQEGNTTKKKKLNVSILRLQAKGCSQGMGVDIAFGRIIRLRYTIR